jgi:hypothetical protein
VRNSISIKTRPLRPLESPRWPSYDYFSFFVLHVEPTSSPSQLFGTHFSSCILVQELEPVQVLVPRPVQVPVPLPVLALVLLPVVVFVLVLVFLSQISISTSTSTSNTISCGTSTSTSTSICSTISSSTSMYSIFRLVPVLVFTLGVRWLVFLLAL